MKKGSRKNVYSKYFTGGIPPTTAEDNARFSDYLNASILNGGNPVTHEEGRELVRNNMGSLIDAINIFNGLPTSKNLSGENRINAFYNWNSGNEDVEAWKDRFRTINYTPAIDSRTSPDVRTAGGIRTNTGLVKFPMGTGLEGVIGQAPQLLDSIFGLLENNPNTYSKEPVMNANTMRGMVTPYSFAYGGSLQDLGIDEETLSQLQAMAAKQGISVEELIEQLASGNDTVEVPNPEETPDIETEDGVEVMDEGEGTPSEFAYGGMGKANIEVEGNEIMQLPSGKLKRVKGPSHAKGGVPVKVPGGTKIYSNRLSVRGKTMQERKLAREKRLAKLNSMLDDNPTDKLLQNTLKRVASINQQEEAYDMKIQEAANAVYNHNQMKKAAYGMEVPYKEPGPRYNWRNIFNATSKPNLDPITFTQTIPGTPEAATNFPDLDFNPISGNVPIEHSLNLTPISAQQKAAADKAVSSSNPMRNSSPITAGDAIGLAGTTFGMIAPLLNTLDAAGNSRPNINRYKSFGQDALNTNQSAIDIAAKDKVGVISDIDTATQSSYARNRNSARGINTLRALDALSSAQSMRAKNEAENNFTTNKLNLLGQRSQLQNVADLHRMRGEQMRDMEDKADLDNIYSNLAQNYAGIGEGIQSIGRNLNISRENEINRTLLGQLSQYGLTFDEDGNLISK